MNPEKKEPRVLGSAKKREGRSFHLTKKQKIIGGVTLGLLTAVASYFLFFKSSGLTQQVPISSATIKKNVPAEKIYSPLSGAEVTEEQAARTVTALIIENSVDARPQSGLDQAEVVFEAIAEGGITRFAALYQTNRPAEIGPVRSLRPYYLDWLRPFNPTMAHVGGSKRALSLVRDGSWRDMDQFANGKSFWRSTERRAPHNVYTSFDKLDSYNQAKSYGLKDLSSFPRKEDTKSTTPTASTINLSISSKLYNSVFNYEASSNSYLRSQAGKPHLDKSGKQLGAKAVIALVTKTSIVQEDGSRYSYQTIGTDQAVIFQDGVATEVTWQKPDQASQLKFLDATGTEVKLNRGQAWLTALSSRDKVSWL